MEFIFSFFFLFFYKLALSFLKEVARYIQSIQNRELVIFLQYIKKKVSQQLFVFYFDAEYSDISHGVLSYSLLLDLVQFEVEFENI